MFVLRKTEDLLKVVAMTRMVEDRSHCVLQGGPDVARAESDVLFVHGKVK
jgi:hypothetical protein